MRVADHDDYLAVAARFNIRAKQDTFNDTTRVRYTVTKATPVDWSAAANELAEDIKALM